MLLASLKYKKKWCRYRSLRVAYIDETEKTIDGKSRKFYFSVLVKGGDKLDEVCKNNLYSFGVFVFII